MIIIHVGAYSNTQAKLIIQRFGWVQCALQAARGSLGWKLVNIWPPFTFRELWIQSVLVKTLNVCICWNAEIQLFFYFNIWAVQGFLCILWVFWWFQFVLNLRSLNLIFGWQQDACVHILYLLSVGVYSAAILFRRCTGLRSLILALSVCTCSASSWFYLSRKCHPVVLLLDHMYVLERHTSNSATV